MPHPSIFSGDEVGARSDQYSLAVVTYELLTGRTPFEEADPAQLVNALLTRQLPAPSSVRTDLPKWVDVVLGRALAKSPADRYDSIAHFGRALARGPRIESRDGHPARDGAVAVERRAARHLRAGRAPRPRPSGQRSLQRHPSRARPSSGDSSAAPRRRSQLGRRARPLPPRSADAAGLASLDHPGARLRRRRGSRLSRHRLHRRVQPARGAEDRRRDAVAAPAAAAGATRRSGSRAAPEGRTAVRPRTRDHAGRPGRRWGAPDDLDRGHLAGGGPLGDAGGRDAAGDGAGRRRAPLRRAGAADRPERRRAVRRVHDGRARLRDGDRGAAVRRRVDARAPRRDAARPAEGSAGAAADAARCRRRGDSEGPLARAGGPLPDRERLRRWPSASRPSARGRRGCRPLLRSPWRAAFPRRAPPWSPLGSGSVRRRRRPGAARRTSSPSPARPGRRCPRS